MKQIIFSLLKEGMTSSPNYINSNGETTIFDIISVHDDIGEARRHVYLRTGDETSHNNWLRHEVDFFIEAYDVCSRLFSRLVQASEEARQHLLYNIQMQSISRIEEILSAYTGSNLNLDIVDVEHPMDYVPLGRSFGVYEDAKFECKAYQHFADKLIQLTEYMRCVDGKVIALYGLYTKGADWIKFLASAEMMDAKGSFGDLKWISRERATWLSRINKPLGIAVKTAISRMKPIGDYYVFEKKNCPEYIWMNL